MTALFIVTTVLQQYMTVVIFFLIAEVIFPTLFLDYFPNFFCGIFQNFFPDFFPDFFRFFGIFMESPDFLLEFFSRIFVIWLE